VTVKVSSFDKGMVMWGYTEQLRN